jgi:hypothetical protein
MTDVLVSTMRMARRWRSGAGPLVTSLFALVLFPTASPAAALTNARTMIAQRSLVLRDLPPPSISSTGVWRNSRLLIPVNKSFSPADAQVFVRKGGSFVVATNAMTNFNNAPHLAVNSNQAFIVHQAQQAQKVTLSTKPTFLPDEVAMYLSEKECIYGRIYLVQERLMAYDPKLGEYATTVSIGFASTNPAALASRLLPQTVRFRCQHTRLSTNEVVLQTPGTTGEAQVGASCSRTYRNEEVVARSDLGEQPITLEFEKLGLNDFLLLFFPLPVFYATFTGGVLGGLLRTRQPTRKRRTEWYWLVFEGVVVGLFLMAAVAAGLMAPFNLAPDLRLSVPAGFALGLVGGLYGTRLIDKWTKNRFEPTPAESTKPSVTA